MAEVKFTATKDETKTIRKILHRAKKMFPTAFRTKGGVHDLHMDIEAVHSNGCPLDLQKLLDAADFDFAHDIAGIYRCLDRTTGTLRNHFRPRCALPQAEVANG